MATSESDDFESADEELAQEQARRTIGRKWSPPTAIDSESDDDTEYVPRSYEKVERHSAVVRSRDRKLDGDKGNEADNAKPESTTLIQRRTRMDGGGEGEGVVAEGSVVPAAPGDRSLTSVAGEGSESGEGESVRESGMAEGRAEKLEEKLGEQLEEQLEGKLGGKGVQGGARVRVQRKSEGLKHQLGAKRLGARVLPGDEKADGRGTVEDELAEGMGKVSTEGEAESKVDDTVEIENSLMNELAEPEELKSNKKFKEIFEPQGWEGLGNDIELPDDLTEEKLQPVLDRLASVGGELEGSSGGWGSWGSWGVSTLLNTATAGVSTLTSHVSHGLTLLEESIGTPDSPEDAVTKDQEESPTVETEPSTPQESHPLASFGFGNFISGVSSITKLVESTGSKVMSGGLDTLEAIGKKTMEVLQEGDPGLKKKRAFFTNDSEKPNLSQVLREAKEKADAAEKTLEEKEWARKIHFESLFDDYQGLVHLEALEMLSKQSAMKIQQHLANLTGAELNSIQETLEDVKELCDPTDEDEEDAGINERELKLRLEDACSDLGLEIAYEKLCTIWNESQSYLSTATERNAQETFQTAISALAQFTAFSIERFHKTAELLLIKQRRSTVNEADALVQLTRILSNQIGLLANSYCNALNELAKMAADPEEINGNVTTVFMEATNASSYVEDAFRLLIPIVQVGAI